MPFIADTVRLGPGSAVTSPPQHPQPSGIFAQAARDAQVRVEEAFRRRQKNLDLLTTQAEMLAERDFGLFRQFVAELEPLGFVSHMAVGPFALSRDPHGDITRPVTLFGSNIGGPTSKQVTFKAAYVGTGLTRYEIRDTRVLSDGQWVREFAPDALEGILLTLADDLSQAAARRAFNETRDHKRPS